MIRAGPEAILSGGARLDLANPARTIPPVGLLSILHLRQAATE